MGNIKAGDLEKIYTPNKITDFCIDILKEQFKDEITEFLEPCAGAGDMVDRIQYHYKNVPIIAYDIQPERSDIIEANYLKLKLDYKKGRVCLMNPPFSRAIKFIYKALEECDIVVTLSGTSTFMILDYDKYEVKELYFIKKAEFLDGNQYGINVICIVKK